jgi:uncharacterized protein YdeI (YjbR/CyaY-like superfamily)
MEPPMRQEQAAPGTDAPILSFESGAALRRWLGEHHASSDGIWIQLCKVSSGRPTVTFLEVLDEGLCFGWSESQRRSWDDKSYLQRFSPRRRAGTTSERNRNRVARLIEEGRMTQAGLAALGLETDNGARGHGSR